MGQVAKRAIDALKGIVAKTRYDRGNLFRHNQNIRRSAS